jgi:hypothetical protein
MFKQLVVIVVIVAMTIVQGHSIATIAAAVRIGIVMIDNSITALLNALAI